MLKTYEETLAWLYNQPTGKSQSFAELLEKLNNLGNPHLSSQLIHIAGTNGKGSTTAFLSSLLQAHGKKVMCFTSPHLYRINERFTYQQLPISDEQFITYVNRLTDLHLSQFELFLFIFFLYMADCQPDYAIIEAGIGGLLDSTNLISPVLSIITSIGMDHEAILGHCLAAIAKQKAGIIKPNVPVIVGDVPSETEPIIEKVAFAHQAPYLKSGHAFQVEALSTQVFLYNKERYTMQLIGFHQANNASLALQATQHLLKEAFSLQASKEAIFSTKWAGRMEEILPNVYVDGAHNEQGILSLVQTIQSAFQGKQVKILFGALQRKDYVNMLRLLSDYDVTVTEFDHPQSICVDDFKEERVHTLKRWQDFLLHKEDNTIYVITGSLYFISEVKIYLEN